MNFTTTVKNEILALEVDRDDELMSELAGYLSAREELKLHEAEGVVSLDYLERVGDFKDSYEFKLKVNGDIVRLISIYGLKSFISEGDSQIMRAYIRGAFLSSGSVSNPKSSYHFEINFRNQAEAMFAKNILARLSVESGLIEKKDGSHIVYIKDSSMISDALTLMGAINSTLELEDEMVIKSRKNDINRRVNCETANMTKTINASLRQQMAIEKLQDSGRFELLEASLYETGLLRIANPDASLNELVILSGGRLTKSGINHRLNKLIELSEEI